MGVVHVIGAGLAGLSAAVTLAAAGRTVHVYEAAPRAGGRCRSYFDTQLERTIDNGGHVLLEVNWAAHAFVEKIGAAHELDEIVPAAFPFVDLTTGESWTLRPNAGWLPWWIFSRARRVPGTAASDYLRLALLFGAGPDDVVTDLCDPASSVFRRLIEPLATAVLNTKPEAAAARPLARVLASTLLRGERACRIGIAHNGLSAAFVDPAVAYLARMGASLHFNARINLIDIADARVRGFHAGGRRIDVGPRDAIVLAVPSWSAAMLLPRLRVPAEHSAIVNAHFRIDRPVELPGGHRILGLIGGTAQWLIVRGDVVSVTVSAADDLCDRPADEVLAVLWRDIAGVLRMPAQPLPPARLVKERRATFRQTPAAERDRLGPNTGWHNLVLAGDWTATGLPATIEGAIRSGETAAALVNRIA
ncbi:MAG TPA: hydroxysqualene dehydroxylase HpnE [Alphaproteobacteria bacterium]